MERSEAFGFLPPPSGWIFDGDGSGGVAPFHCAQPPATVFDASGVTERREMRDGFFAPKERQGRTEVLGYLIFVKASLGLVPMTACTGLSALPRLGHGR